MLPHMHHTQEEFSHTKGYTAPADPYVTEGMNQVFTEQNTLRWFVCVQKTKQKNPHIIYMCLMYAAHIEAHTCAHA